jgi:AcrR family transcriptional regulator
MGPLIDPERRRRAKLEREERKTRILKVARSTFAKLPYVEVTLDAIGHRADVDRGVVSMYFRSKEELFLILLREELDLWFSSLETELGQTDGGLLPKQLAELLATSLAGRSDLTRFLSFESVVLEQNLDAMEVFRFQRWRRDRMAGVGDLLAVSVDGLETEGALRLLHRLQLLAAALKPVADPKGAATFEVGDPDFAAFEVDFEAELETFVTAIIEAELRVEISKS